MIMIIMIIIIMYIYHVLINALSAHMIPINLNMIFYTHVDIPYQRPPQGVSNLSTNPTL